MAQPSLSVKAVNSDISQTKLCQVQMNFLTVLPFCLTLFQLQFGFMYGYGEICKELLTCQGNEICSLIIEDKWVCNCREGFVEFTENKTCISRSLEPPPSNTHSGALSVGVGVTVAVILVLLVLSIGFLHRRYRILDGVIHSIYRFRRRPSRWGQAYEVADEGDDVNPIV